MASRRWLFAALLCGLALPVWSQRASGWRAYRRGDGLPESACASVTIALSGRVLTTHPAVQAIGELDGYAVWTFPLPQGQSIGVSESPGGQLWALTPDGLQVWKDKSWILHPVPEIAAEFRKGAASGSIPFLPVQQGRVFFLLPDRLMEFNAEELNRPQTAVLRDADRTQLGNFSSMSLSRDGGLWIAGARGLAKTPGPVRSLKPEDTWRESIPPESLGIQKLGDPREDADGGVTLIAILTNGQSIGVYFDGTNWSALPFTAPDIRFTWRGPDRVFRAASAASLWRWNQGQVVESDEISAREYFGVAVEPGGAFWLATSEGLFRYAQPAWRIPGPLEALAAPVRCVTADAAGRFWFVAGGKLHSLQGDASEEFLLPEPARNSSKATLFPLKNGTLLVGVADAAYQFNPDNGRFGAIQAPGQPGRLVPLGSLKDRSVCVESAASGAAATLLIYDGDRFQLFPTALPEPLGREAHTAFFEAQNGDAWLGGSAVACCREEKWRTFVSADRTTPEGAVCFAEMSDGKIWCGTADKIWEFDGRNWTIVRSGFDRLNALFRGADGSIWAASENGLHRFWQGAWIESGPEEGLAAAAVNDVCEDQQGRVWAATARGLCRYFPEADVDPPKTGIQKLVDENQKLYEGAMLNLLFSGQDKWKFTSRDRLLYSYRLDQHDWSAFQELNAVSFPDLAAGKHFVQVRAMDRNGNAESPVQLEFAVALPWYRETRLVMISFAGLATALFFAALSYNRHRKLLRSYAEVERKVTERTRELEIASRELFQSQKMNALGTLAAGIAHDFNNILSIIKGSAQIIEENPDNPEKVRTRLDRIKTVVEQGSGIVKAMLGFSRDSDEQPLRIDLNGVVDDTIRLLGDRFVREVEVKFERAADLPQVQASRNFIQQILLNFLFNAAESMTGRKQVLLATHRFTKLPAGVMLPPAGASEYVAVSIRDTGCGIPPENLPRIFEPFFTTKSLSARRGTGLGLSMVYELAKKLEAGLAVESVLDEGSVFTLVLPVREVAA